MMTLTIILALVCLYRGTATDNAGCFWVGASVLALAVLS